MVHQRHRRIHDQSGFAGAFDAPWSRQILDHWSELGSPQRNTPLNELDESNNSDESDGPDDLEEQDDLDYPDDLNYPDESDDSVDLCPVHTKA